MESKDSFDVMPPRRAYQPDGLLWLNPEIELPTGVLHDRTDTFITDGNWSWSLRASGIKAAVRQPAASFRPTTVHSFMPMARLAHAQSQCETSRLLSFTNRADGRAR